MESPNVEVLVRLNIFGASPAGVLQLCSLTNDLTRVMQITTAIVTVRGIGHGVGYTASLVEEFATMLEAD
jgi:hypothetical protein